MSDNRYEKSAPSAPPPYPGLYSSDNAPVISEPPQYGFQPPPQPQPGYVQYQQPYSTGYPSHPPPGNIPYPQTIQPAPINQQTVVVLGGCPSCRVGTLEDDYTCCGILCAICFFPIGILCCLAMKEKRCTHCKATF